MSAWDNLWLLPLFFFTGGAAGFVDAIAGGGGLITLPVLLNAGLPPQLALGTNKAQAIFGSGSATWHFARAGLIDFSQCRMGIGFTAVGALAGTLAVSRVNTDLLERSIPVALIAIALFVLARPQLGDAATAPRFMPSPFYAGMGLALGFYDGLFGPGTGTFWALAHVLGLGLPLKSATARTKLMNFASNAISLGAFLLLGLVDLRVGIAMGLGQIIGARLGARAVILRGASLIRPLLVLVTLGLALRLLYQAL